MHHHQQQHSECSIDLLPSMQLQAAQQHTWRWSAAFSWLLLLKMTVILVPPGDEESAELAGSLCLLCLSV